MYELGTGILPNSCCVPLTVTAHAQQIYFYPVLCGHYFCDQEYEVNRSFYENPLLIILRNGKMQLDYMGQTYSAEKGDILLLDCSKPHRYAAENNVEFLYLHFDGGNAHELVRSLTEESPLLKKENHLEINEQLYELIHRYEQHGIENEAESSLQIYQLLMGLAIPPKSMIRQDGPIQQTVTYIREHSGDGITLSQLAAIAHLSTYHYAHEFKRVTGFAPMEYVINTRLEKAKMLLLQTTLSVIDIAYEVGYESGSSLSSMFLKKYGYSPREYRRTNGIH